jgi:hypothetical protein
VAVTAVAAALAANKECIHAVHGDIPACVSMHLKLLQSFLGLASSLHFVDSLLRSKLHERIDQGLAAMSGGCMHKYRPTVHLLFYAPGNVVDDCAALGLDCFGLRASSFVRQAWVCKTGKFVRLARALQGLDICKGLVAVANPHRHR